MNEFEIDGKIFRIKKMNAIEILALRNHTDFDQFEGTIKFFNLALEHLEYKVKEDWLPVKEKNAEIYYPAGIEEDLDLTSKLINKFLEWLESVFRKSSELKE